MSFEYIIAKDDSKKQLNEEEKNTLVKNISTTFANLNSQRSSNLEMASNLANEIFFKNDFKYLRDKNKKWKAKIKMCKTFMFYQTLKAFIWRNTLQMLVLCSMYQEKTTTQTICQTSKKQCLWTSLKRWISKKPVIKLSITLCYLAS